MSRTPPMVATYRLQVMPAFGFNEARRLIPYLTDLGISHLYLSPIFEARPGSTHGYDQTDPTRIRAELGGEHAFHALAEAAVDAGLGILLDIVPNHMATHHANPWWFGLLKHGRGSPFDTFFDVWWDEGGERVVLPVLGESLEQCVAAGQLQLRADAALGPCVAYFDRLFPLREDRPIPPDGSGRALLAALRQQHYELAFWRDGLERINYRRFFDIADLAGLRAEDEAVFEATHARVLDLVAEGHVHGVRVDHIDGLLDPLAYLRRLRSRLDRAAGPHVPIYIEKILAHDESLSAAWSIAGTTGYEFLAAMAQLDSNGAGFDLLRNHAQSGRAAPFHDLAVACKREAATTVLSPELNRVRNLISRTLAAGGCELPEALVGESVVAVSSNLGVYRTYADRDGMGSDDIARVRRAMRSARGDSLADPLLELLTLSGPFASDPHRAAALECVQRWQQFTGPLAAKGVEDTALYRDTSCPWLCDVGSEPQIRDPEQVWRGLSAQRQSWPLSLNASDTHDAKRSEDVRAVLATLSHFPEDWTGIVDEGIALASSTGVARADLVLLLHSAFALLEPDASVETTPDRIKLYLVKAVREAKVRSSWVNPNTAYERACESAVDLVLSPAGAGLVGRMMALRERIQHRVQRASVGHCILKCLFPGVPDIYQGAELPVFSLVDPDNRRTVDFQKRTGILDLVRRAWTANDHAACSQWDMQKLLALWRALALRRGLSALGPLALESFRWSTSRWVWTVCAGRARCKVRVEMDASTSPPLQSGAVDQFAGMLREGGRTWATACVEGVTELW